MKLLFDENLSDRLVTELDDVFPGSSHVKGLGMTSAEDAELWRHARENGFTLVSKDKDFQALCALHGAPPQVVWLRLGNTSTQQIAALRRGHAGTLRELAANPKKALLILTDSESSPR